MDAFGFDRVLVETVGVGQTELEITGAADTVVVILVPESGDAIQAMKAGLMEIADIFVVNKADRPGAERLVKDLRVALHLREGKALKDVPAHHGVDLTRLADSSRSKPAGAPGGAPEPEAGPGPAGELGPDGGGGQGEAGWEIPVLLTVAQSGEGVDDLVQAIAAHRAFLESSGALQARREARAAGRVRDVVNRQLRRLTWDHPGVASLLDNGVGEIVAGRETPYSLAKAIIAEFME